MSNPQYPNTGQQGGSFPPPSPDQASYQPQYNQPQYQASYSQPGANMGQPPLQPNYSQPYYAPPSPASNDSRLMDFLTFRWMVTPVIIQVIFWLGIFFIVISALVQITSAYNGSVISGLITLIIGPLLWRVVCELYILLFRINGNLTEIKNDLKQRR